MRVYVHGIGPFDEGPVSGRLELFYKTTSTESGVVAPTVSVLVTQYQDDLAATRADWTVDES